MAEQNINPGIQALQKAGYTPEQIGQFGQIYNQRAIAMGYGEDVPKMYVPTQDDNASIIQEFSRSITNATLPALAKGITLIPQVLTNAAGFAPQALDEWTNDIIKSIDQNYTGYVNPMHNRGMFEKNEKGEWGITDARSIINGFGSGIGSLVTAFGIGAATGTGAAGVVASAALMSLPELWKSGQEAGLADIDNARMSLVLAPIIGGLELIGGLETGLLKSFEKEVVGELAEGAIARGLKSAGLKESLELIGKNVPDEAMFKDATAASIRKLSTWGAKFASGKTVKEGFGEATEEYLQNFVNKAGEQIYDTWFSEAGAKPGQGQYGTELFVPETDQRAIGPSFLGVSYNKDEFYDDLQSAIYGGILGHGMSAITTPVVNQSMYGYIDVAVKKGRADGAIQQMSGLIQQNIQEGKMTEEQGKQAMTTATNMVGLANLLKNTPVTTTPTLRYAVYDNQYNKIPKYNQVTQGFEDAANGLSAMLEDNMAGIAQVAALQDEVKRMYPEYKKSQLRTQVTNNFIRSIVTKGQPTDLEGQLAEIDKMQFDIMEDDAFKDLMRGYMLALPQIGSESRGFEPPAGPPSVPPAGGTPPTAGGDGAAPSGTTPPTGGATPPSGTPPTGTPLPSETPPTKPVEESGQMAPAGKPQTWVQAMGAPVLFRGQEGTIVYDDTDGYLFIPEETSNEVVITKDSSQNPADLGIEFTNTYNPIEYAVQEQTTDEGVLRPEQPQVELQQMGKGDQEPQVPAQEGQEKEISDEEAKQPMLEGLPDGGLQEEGGQEGAELRPEAEEKALTPEAPQAIADMQQELEGQQSQPPTQQIDNESEAIISGEDRESSQGLDSLGASLESQGAAGAAEAGGVRPEAVQQPGGEGQGATGGEQIAEGERKGQPAANRQDFIQTASEGGVGQAAPEIKERYDSSTKYVSAFDEDSTVEKTLPEGSKRKVKVILGEASAVTPSHSPFTFGSTPGFPKNESGQNINTNDYSESKNIEAVTMIATNFDSRALDDMPFVKDGVVYSGNNRTMSRQLAATQGTDAAYISALRQQARRLGFTEEQINSLKHPFIWMEIQDDIKPTSEEYAKYNQSREKQQDPISEAVAMGKKVNQNTLRILGDLMGRYDTFNQFASSKDAADFIKGLIDIKLINYQMAMSLIDEGGRVNDKGKTFLRSMLLGNVLSEDNVRKFSEEGFLTYTNRIMNAISELSWNLGKEAYSILADVNDALKIQKAIMDIQAKTPGAPYEGALQAYLNQRTIGEKIMSPNAILLNVLLNKGDKDFKRVMNEYIQKADEASKGAFDMFAGPAKVVSKDEIIADIMKAYMEGSKLTDIEKGVINSYAGFIKEQAAGGGKAVINEVDNAAQADQVKAKANNIANKYKKC